MLKVYDKNATDFTNNGLGPLQNAQNVKVTREINGEYTLSFSLPGDDPKWEYIQQRNKVICEGQQFRVFRYGQTIDGNINKTVDCLHVITDAAQRGEKFIPDFPDCIGFTPRAILLTAFAGTSFNVMSESEVTALGMNWVTDPTDIFECSKTYPLEIVKKVIESIKKGELYIDNYNIALVERIGKDTGLNCTLSSNLQSISADSDGENIVTRLYALGIDGMPLPSAEAPHGYIDSALGIAQFGIRADYMDFDTEDPNELLEQALWQFSPDNPKRIDIPDESYAIKLIELYKLFGNNHRVNIGDSIRIKNKRSGIEATQRIIKYIRYPFSADQSEVTLGRPAKTYMDVLKESNQTTQKYNRIVNQSGQIKASWLETLIGNLQQTVNSALKDVSLHRKGDLWEFENNSAIAIVDGILAIANERNPDGSWKFRTFGTGNGFTADEIVAGILKAIIIEGCTINGGIINVQTDVNVGNFINIGDLTAVEEKGINFYNKGTEYTRILAGNDGGMEIAALSGTGEINIFANDKIELNGFNGTLSIGKYSGGGNDSEFRGNIHFGSGTVYFDSDSFVSGLVTGTDGAHNHGITPGTRIPTCDIDGNITGSVVFVQSGSHYHWVVTE